MFSAKYCSLTKCMAVSWKGSKDIGLCIGKPVIIEHWIRKSAHKRNLNETHSLWQWLSFHPSVPHCLQVGVFCYDIASGYLCMTIFLACQNISCNPGSSVYHKAFWLYWFLWLLPLSRYVFFLTPTPPFYTLWLL